MGELIFPSDLGSNAQSSNFMGFQGYTLTGGVGSARTDRSYNMSGNAVYLPIPVEGVQDQYVNNWGGSETVNAAKMLLGQNIAGIGEGVTSSGGLIDKITSKIGGAAGAGGNPHVQGVANRASTMWDSVMAGLDVGDVGPALKDITMQGIKAASPFAIGAVVGGMGNAVTQSTGLAGFEETSVVYNGPQFRNFSFNFSLKPLTQLEQGVIEAIINHFKLAAAPQEFAGTLYRIYSLPKVFEIKFYHKDGENKSLTKIGKCALTNIGIKYGGDRFQTFAAGHAPVQTDISLQFTELVLQTHNTIHAALMEGMDEAAAANIDDFGAIGNNVGGERAKAANAARAKDAAAAANVDSFGGATGFAGGAGAAGTGSVDTFGATPPGNLNTGSAMGAVKSKASGGASFIPDGGAG